MCYGVSFICPNSPSVKYFFDPEVQRRGQGDSQWHLTHLVLTSIIYNIVLSLLL